MIVDRIFTPGLAQVAYLVADEAAGEVAVIDPRRDVDAYISWADQRHLRITTILETHVHADFVSGARELEIRTGAPIHASRLGDQVFPHRPLDDGDQVKVGRLGLQAYFTPGHTPEHMAYLLYEGDGAAPAALFSGDALFVGDVGRPDLLGKDATERLSHQLFETVTRRLATLPNELIVHPGHTAGSACGKKIGEAPHTSIGQEKMDNYAFREKERDEFVKSILSDMPTPPAYYPVLKRVNTQGTVLIDELMDPRAFDSNKVEELIGKGALVVDTRDKADFGLGHIPGSLFAGFGPNFHTWMGWIAPYDHDILLVTGDNGSVDEVVTALRQIGLDRVVGYLDGGMKAWTGETEALEQMTVGQLWRQLDKGLAVLDVRSDAEWRDDHIGGSGHLFAGEIAQGAVPPDSLGPDRRTAVICGSGYRSWVVASILQAQGYRNLVNVDGGMFAWKDADLPVVTESGMSIVI